MDYYALAPWVKWFIDRRLNWVVFFLTVAAYPVFCLLLTIQGIREGTSDYFSDAYSLTKIRKPRHE